MTDVTTFQPVDVTPEMIDAGTEVLMNDYWYGECNSMSYAKAVVRKIMERALRESK
jgi:hypothetical protein